VPSLFSVRRTEPCLAALGCGALSFVFAGKIGPRRIASSVHVASLKRKVDLLKACTSASREIGFTLFEYSA